MCQKVLIPHGRIMKRDAIPDIKCCHTMCVVYLCRSQLVGAIERAVGDGGWCGDKETARKRPSFRLAAKEKQSTVSFTF